jgi:hypothetical protein
MRVIVLRRCQYLNHVASSYGMTYVIDLEGYGGSGRGLIELLSQYFRGGTEENHENLSQDNLCTYYCKHRALLLHEPARSSSVSFTYSPIRAVYFSSLFIFHSSLIS